MKRVMTSPVVLGPLIVLAACLVVLVLIGVKTRWAAADEKLNRESDARLVVIAESFDAQAAVPAVPDAAIPAGHKLAYDAARSRAIDQYAKEKKVTRRAARAAIEKVSDAHIHQAVTAAGLTVGDAPAPGFLDKLVAWFEDHKDVLEAIIKLILTLAPLLGL